MSYKTGYLIIGLAILFCVMAAGKFYGLPSLNPGAISAAAASGMQVVKHKYAHIDSGASIEEMSSLV